MNLRPAAAALGVLFVTGACAAADPVAAVTPTPVAGSPSAPSSPAPTTPPSSSPTPVPSPARPSTRVLAIRQHYQQHNLSCEAAALVMALAYEGIVVDEMTLMKYMPIDTRAATLDAAGRLVAWGDPNQAYIGNPDGNIHRYTGYGVYFAPVARAARRAGGTVLRAGGGLYGSAIPPRDLYDAVLDGHPAVVWISNTYGTVPLRHYVAYGGGVVAYTLAEHAITVIGVRPDAVLVNDPWFGQAWRPKAQFEAAYRTFEDMAVILR